MSIIESRERLIDRMGRGAHEISVIGSIAKHPVFKKDIDLLIVGLNEAFSIYKRVLYQSGIRPIEIVGRVNEIREGLTPEKAVRFIQVANCLATQNKANNTNGTEENGYH